MQRHRLGALEQRHEFAFPNSCVFPEALSWPPGPIWLPVDRGATGIRLSSGGAVCQLKKRTGTGVLSCWGFRFVELARADTLEILKVVVSEWLYDCRRFENVKRRGIVASIMLIITGDNFNLISIEKVQCGNQMDVSATHFCPCNNSQGPARRRRYDQKCLHMWNHSYCTSTSLSWCNFLE